MVKGKTMLQVQGTFGVAKNVQAEEQSRLFAYTWLHSAPHNRVTVREVSAQQAYFSGFSGPSGSGEGAIVNGGSAVATFTLVVDSSRKFSAVQALMKEQILFGTKHYFHAPSYRDSPEVDGPDLAFLAVRMPSWSVNPPWKIQSAKRIAGHVYFDEVAKPLPPVKMKSPPKSAPEDRVAKAKITKVSKAKKSASSSKSVLLEFGPGEVMLALTDLSGNALSQMQFSLAGDPYAKGGIMLPMSLNTNDGAIAVAPTIISRSSADLEISIANLDANLFVRERAKVIGCSENVVKQLDRGKVKRSLPTSDFSF